MMVINTSRLLLTLLLLEFAAVAVPAMASTVVAGMVFCDQCKDGARGLFDYPLYGRYMHAVASSHLMNELVMDGWMDGWMGHEVDVCVFDACMHQAPAWPSSAAAATPR